MISILLIFLACSLGYSLWLWIHNNLAEQMIKSKDIMIRNLQLSNRMKDATIDRLRSRIYSHQRTEFRLRRKLFLEKGVMIADLKKE